MSRLNHHGPSKVNPNEHFESKHSCLIIRHRHCKTLLMKNYFIILLVTTAWFYHQHAWPGRFDSNVSLTQQPLVALDCSTELSTQDIDDRNHRFLHATEDLPQILTFGQYLNESAYPFISTDIWADLVDNNHSFYVRTRDSHFPGYTELKKWIASRRHPISIIMNNNEDVSWPEDPNAEDWKEMLREPNLHAVYVGLMRMVDDEFKPKVKPLPIGLKWQFHSINLFGEEKASLKSKYASVSTSPCKTNKLFQLPNRTNTVFVRPMSSSNGNTINYEKNNAALATSRSEIPHILRQSAPNSTVVFSGHFLDQMTYMEELKKHRFLVNPAGNGIDTHSTWEALLAGCIPINPHSPMDRMFDGLPVWFVNSWEEVTDEAVLIKSQEITAQTYDWSMAFAQGWRRKIHEGLSI